MPPKHACAKTVSLDNNDASTVIRYRRGPGAGTSTHRQPEPRPAEERRASAKETGQRRPSTQHRSRSSSNTRTIPRRKRDASAFEPLTDGNRVTLSVTLDSDSQLGRPAKVAQRNGDAACSRGHVKGCVRQRAQQKTFQAVKTLRSSGDARHSHRD